MGVRLQKFLADAGVASRRKSEEIIAHGGVMVNGAIVKEMGRKINPDMDIIEVNGKKIKASKEHVYYMLHKPEGYITSASDQFKRPTVLDFFTELKTRIYPVGRLDYDTSGLLLLTNDGMLTQALTHPSHQVEKIYIARVRGIPSLQEQEDFRNGLWITEGDIDNQTKFKTSSAKIQIIKKIEKVNGIDSSLRITICEGRNRQVRKMCEAIGHPVIALKRVATGKIYLGNLPKGENRKLTRSEISYLYSIVSKKK